MSHHHPCPVASAPASHPGLRHPERQRGVALIIAIFFTIFGLGLILSGTIVMDAAGKKSEVAFRLDGQARQFAEAGLIDAVGWFRRQTTQPVTSFTPVLDTLATPPILDTSDPAIGIVREFEISRGVWGRYEVRKFIPNVSPQEAEVADISTQRGAAAAGTIWKLVSRGFVYRLLDSGAAFNEAPNQVLGTEVMETEVRRLTLVPPAQAALCVDRADSCVVSSKGRVIGGMATGIAWKSSTGSASLSGEVSGTPSTAGIASYDSSIPAVFGVNADTLRSLADDRIVSDPEFPYPVPTNHILHVTGDLSFTKTRRLSGTGVVYVKGNVTIQAGSNSFFNGLLYVDGNLTVNAPALLRGSVIVTGLVRFQGVGDFSELEYDDSVLNSLMLEVGQYRISSSVRRSDLRDSLKR